MRPRVLWLAALALAAAAAVAVAPGRAAAPGVAHAREVHASPPQGEDRHCEGECTAEAQHPAPAAALTPPQSTKAAAAAANPPPPAAKPPAAAATKPPEPAKPAAAAQNPAEPAKAAAASKPPQPVNPAGAAKSAEPAKPAAEKSAEPAKLAAAPKPAEPAKPAATKPAEPAAASKPAEPAKSAGTTKPLEPAKPAASATKTAEPAKPAATETKPSEPVKPAVTTKSAEQAKPATAEKKSAEPAKPATETKSAEPAKPAAATKPAEPAKPAATATKPAEPAKPAATTKPAESAKPTATATKPAEPAKPAATTKPAESAKTATKPAEPSKPAPATKPAEPAKPTPVKPAEAPKPVEAKPAEAAKPAPAKSQEPPKPAETKQAEATNMQVEPMSPSGVALDHVDKRDVAEKPARILAVIPFNARSHFVMYGPLFRALADRGHQVDVLSHYPLEQPPPNYQDLSVSGAYESWEDNVDMDLIASFNPLTDAIAMWQESLDVCAKVLEHPTARQLLRSNQHYDLVISEVFGTECMAGFAHKFRAPLVGLVSSVALPGTLDRMGNPEHPAYTSNYFLPYTERMGFAQRLVNTFYGWALKRLKYLLCDRPTDAMARRFFGPDLPSTTELVQNTSLVLVNSHFSINQVRPMVPGVVEVGGLHIGDHKRLPEELDRWVAASRAGVVLFSLGTMVRVSTWSPDRLQALWAALGALPQRVIIKSRDPLPGAPPNVRVERWLPQFDLLHHPHVVLFVTHGGLMGAQEAVSAGVPLLGVPMFGDQRLNLHVLAAKGVALVLEYQDITRDRLADAFHKLIQDPGYRQRMTELSRQFRDRPRDALSSAVWWLEYVVRHEGARHLRSAAADLPLHQYLLLDVAALAAATLALVVGFVWFLLATVYRFLGFGSQGFRRRGRLPSVSVTGQRKRYTKTKQH